MRRRTVCLYLDSSLLEEARKAAEVRGASLSELAEEAISLYLQLFDQLRTPHRAAGGRPAAEAPTARPPQPSAPSPSLPTTPPPPPTPPAPQLPPSAPPHLQNNAWVAVLRSRR